MLVEDSFLFCLKYIWIFCLGYTYSVYQNIRFVDGTLYISCITAWFVCYCIETFELFLQNQLLFQNIFGILGILRIHLSFREIKVEYFGRHQIYPMLPHVK